MLLYNGRPDRIDVPDVFEQSVVVEDPLGTSSGHVQLMKHFETFAFAFMPDSADQNAPGEATEYFSIRPYRGGVDQPNSGSEVGSAGATRAAGQPGFGAGDAGRSSSAPAQPFSMSIMLNKRYRMVPRPEVHVGAHKPSSPPAANPVSGGGDVTAVGRVIDAAAIGGSQPLQHDLGQHAGYAAAQSSSSASAAGASAVTSLSQPSPFLLSRITHVALSQPNHRVSRIHEDWTEAENWRNDPASIPPWAAAWAVLRETAGLELHPWIKHSAAVDRQRRADASMEAVAQR